MSRAKAWLSQVFLSHRIVSRFLVSRHLPWLLALVAVLPMSPGIGLGWQIDDKIHRAALTGLDDYPELRRSPSELFVFARGDSEGARQELDRGLFPWWRSPGLRLAFFRPVAGWTHQLDYRLWPREPRLMHLQSLVWFGLMVAAAALLYRRLMAPAALAGLAALFFALDEAHAMPAVWLAGRNATLATFWGLATLLAHDRWRRDGWRPGALLAPLCLLLAVLSNEGAVATGAYLVAYALFIDTDRPARRLVSLLPCAAAGLAWTAAYKVLGYGAQHSGIYVDPATSPLRFARMAVERIPALVRGQWTPLAADVDLMLAESARPALWWASIAFAVFLAALAVALLRRDAVARFWTLGMVLALVPVCSTFPSNRLLFFVGIGGMGLLAQLVDVLWKATGSGGWRRRAARAVALAFVLAHLVVAPIASYFAVDSVAQVGQVLEQAATSLPPEPDKWTLIVNTPTSFVSTLGSLFQAVDGRPAPLRSHVLGSGLYATEVERPDERSLRIRPRGGYLAPPGTPDPQGEASLFSPSYMFQMLDHLYRDAVTEPLALGERVELDGLEIEVTGIDEATGRASEASFRFDRPLEDPSLLWLQWKDGVYAPFEVPEIGQTVVLPPTGPVLRPGF